MPFGILGPCVVTPLRSEPRSLASGGVADVASASRSARFDAKAGNGCAGVALTVSPSITTLNHREVLQATLTPKSLPATNYEWQMKRKNATTWTTYTSTRKDRLGFRPRVAGQLAV